MRLLIISDLHIGANNEFGTFEWNVPKFIDTLEWLKKEHGIEKVILNGDIFDLYQNTYEEISRDYSELINYFGGSDFVYIKGNHDAFNKFGLDFYEIENSEGKKIRIEHGHHADFLNGTRFGRFIGKMGYKLLKTIIHIPFVNRTYYQIVERIDDVNRIPRKHNSFKYLEYALKLLKTYDVVVLAHTHKLESHKTYYLNNKKRYFNCGTCSLGRFQAVTLDTETLDHDTIKISKNKTQILSTENYEHLKLSA